MHLKQSLFLKTTALLTAIVFAVDMRVCSADQAAGIISLESSAVSTMPADLHTVNVPTNLGTIQEIYRGSTDKLVVLIQDAHAVPDAQRNIQKLIGFFEQKYRIPLVALEGAASSLEPLIFKTFPDKELLRKVFEQYFDNGELAGGTAAAVFGQSQTYYHGVENWEWYEEGLRHFLDAMENEKNVNSRVEVITQEIKMEKGRTYSKELLELDHALELFSKNESDLITVLKKCAAIKPPKKGSELALLLEEMSRSDGSGSDSSLDIKVRKIADSIKATLEQKITEEARRDLRTFNEQFQHFLTSRMTAESFALFLKGLSVKHRIRVRVSKELNYLVGHQKRMRDIEGTKFFDDFESYQQSVKESLFRNEEERRIDRRSNQLRLLRGLQKLELSRKDWDEIRRSTGRLAPDKELSELLAAMKPNLDFYENSERRDQMLHERTIRLMWKNKADAALLVAGGFHADGLAAHLRSEGISYVFLMPRIEKLPEETNYRKHMQGDVTWGDYFEVKDGKVNLSSAFVRGTRDLLLKLSKEERGKLLKAWRDEIIRALAAQNRIAVSHDYTKFIDEISESLKGTFPDMAEKWKANVDRFINGLRSLKAEGQLSEQNIANLLRSGTIPDGPTAPAVLSGGELRLDLFPNLYRRHKSSDARSEMRSRLVNKSTQKIIFSGSDNGLENPDYPRWSLESATEPERRAFEDFAERIRAIEGDVDGYWNVLRTRGFPLSDPEDFLSDSNQVALSKKPEGIAVQFISGGNLYYSNAGGTDDLDSIILSDQLETETGEIPFSRSPHVYTLEQPVMQIVRNWKRQKKPAIFVITTDTFNAHLKFRKASLVFLDGPTDAPIPFPSITATLPLSRISEIWISEDTHEIYQALLQRTVKNDREQRLAQKVSVLYAKGKIKVVPDLRIGAMKRQKDAAQWYFNLGRYAIGRGLLARIPILEIRSETRDQPLTPVGLLARGVFLGRDESKQHYYDIRTKGIEPPGEKKFSEDRYPHKVKLGLSFDAGFGSSALNTYGPAQNSKAVAFVLDPEYVRSHPGEFELMGKFFMKPSVTGSRSLFERGLERLGLQNHPVKPSGALLDEIHSDFVPSGALSGVIASPQMAEELIRWDDEFGFPHLPIYILEKSDVDPRGKILVPELHPRMIPDQEHDGSYARRQRDELRADALKQAYEEQRNNPSQAIANQVAATVLLTVGVFMGIPQQDLEGILRRTRFVFTTNPGSSNTNPVDGMFYVELADAATVSVNTFVKAITAELGHVTHYAFGVSGLQPAIAESYDKLFGLIFDHLTSGDISKRLKNIERAANLATEWFSFSDRYLRDLTGEEDSDIKALREANGDTREEFADFQSTYPGQKIFRIFVKRSRLPQRDLEDLADDLDHGFNHRIGDYILHSVLASCHFVVHAAAAAFGSALMDHGHIDFTDPRKFADGLIERRQRSISNSQTASMQQGDGLGASALKADISTLRDKNDEIVEILERGKSTDPIFVAKGANESRTAMGAHATIEVITRERNSQLDNGRRNEMRKKFWYWDPLSGLHRISNFNNVNSAVLRFNLRPTITSLFPSPDWGILADPLGIPDFPLFPSPDWGILADPLGIPDSPLFPSPDWGILDDPLGIPDFPLFPFPHQGILADPLDIPLPPTTCLPWVWDGEKWVLQPEPNIFGPQILFSTMGKDGDFIPSQPKDLLPDMRDIRRQTDEPQEARTELRAAEEAVSDILNGQIEKEKSRARKYAQHVQELIDKGDISDGELIGEQRDGSFIYLLRSDVYPDFVVILDRHGNVLAVGIPFSKLSAPDAEGKRYALPFVDEDGREGIEYDLFGKDLLEFDIQTKLQTKIQEALEKIPIKDRKEEFHLAGRIMLPVINPFLTEEEFLTFVEKNPILKRLLAILGKENIKNLMTRMVLYEEPQKLEPWAHFRPDAGDVTVDIDRFNMPERAFVSMLVHEFMHAVYQFLKGQSSGALAALGSKVANYQRLMDFIKEQYGDYYPTEQGYIDEAIAWLLQFISEGLPGIGILRVEVPITDREIQWMIEADLLPADAISILRANYPDETADVSIESAPKMQMRTQASQGNMTLGRPSDISWRPLQGLTPEQLNVIGQNLAGAVFGKGWLGALKRIWFKFRNGKQIRLERAKFHAVTIAALILQKAGFLSFDALNQAEVERKEAVRVQIIEAAEQANAEGHSDFEQALYDIVDNIVCSNCAVAAPGFSERADWQEAFQAEIKHAVAAASESGAGDSDGIAATVTENLYLHPKQNDDLRDVVARGELRFDQLEANVGVAVKVVDRLIEESRSPATEVYQNIRTTVASLHALTGSLNAGVGGQRVVSAARHIVDALCPEAPKTIELSEIRMVLELADTDMEGFVKAVKEIAQTRIGEAGKESGASAVLATVGLEAVMDLTDKLLRPGTIGRSGTQPLPIKITLAVNFLKPGDRASFFEELLDAVRKNGLHAEVLSDRATHQTLSQKVDSTTRQFFNPKKLEPRQIQGGVQVMNAENQTDIPMALDDVENAKVLNEIYQGLFFNPEGMSSDANTQYASQVLFAAFLIKLAMISNEKQHRVMLADRLRGVTNPAERVKVRAEYLKGALIQAIQEAGYLVSQQVLQNGDFGVINILGNALLTEIVEEYQVRKEVRKAA
jgi:hypothetical protein